MDQNEIIHMAATLERERLRLMTQLEDLAVFSALVPAKEIVRRLADMNGTAEVVTGGSVDAYHKALGVGQRG